MSLGPLDAYRALVARGDITADPAQEIAMGRLDALRLSLLDYAPQMSRSGWMTRLGIGRRPPPKGLYLWGGVGRGKSMLMDLFFEATPEAERKRVHFHAFMREVHHRIHNFRQAVAAGKLPADRDPLPSLARVIVDRAWLLCFDEMQITDIGDAMIVGRLFEALFASGVVVVATSNRPPSDLYKGGLQRDRFLPFIKLMEDHMDVVEVKAATDYRLEKMRSMDVFMTPVSPETDAELEADFRRLTVGAEPAPCRVAVNGREVALPLSAEGVVYCRFADLCGQPLGAADYLEIASRFHTLVLGGIPRLDASRRDEAKRFVTLIDALYEAKVNLICSAEALPLDLYPAGDGAFEFQRTVSRLREMQSEAYMAMVHRT